MRKVHYYTIAAAIALIAVLYFGVSRVPPKKDGAQAPMAGAANGPHASQPASFDSVLSQARTQLPAHAAEEIKTIENQLAAISDSSRMAVVFDTLAKVWLQHHQPQVAAYYFLLEGKLENSEKKLNFAAQLFLEQARKATSEGVQLWSGQMAAEGFNRALQLDPENDSLKVNLAECYIGTGETMQGIMLLRDVTQKHPDNIPANLILGQQGIVSGQFDKAIARFETVVKADPTNIEAMLGMAEAYKNKGDRQKAIELLEHAKQVMNNPEFSKDVDEYIKTF